MLDIDADVLSLQRVIERLGSPRDDGKIAVKYGVLFKETSDEFEALMGTLRAAKKRGVVFFEGQLLLQGVHDDVEVVLLPPKTTTITPETPPGDATAAAPPAAPSTEGATAAVTSDAPANS